MTQEKDNFIDAAIKRLEETFKAVDTVLANPLAMQDRPKHIQRRMWLFENDLAMLTNHIKAEHKE